MPSVCARTAKDPFQARIRSGTYLEKLSGIRFSESVLLIPALLAAPFSGRRRGTAGLPISKLLCFALDVSETELDIKLVRILENCISEFCTPELNCHCTVSSTWFFA